MKTVFCVVSGRELEEMFTTEALACAAIEEGDFYMPVVVEGEVSDAEFAELLAEELFIVMSDNRNACYQVDELATGKAYLVVGSHLLSFLRTMRKGSNYWGHNVDMWCTPQERFDNIDCNPMLILSNGFEEFA